MARSFKANHNHKLDNAELKKTPWSNIPVSRPGCVQYFDLRRDNSIDWHRLVSQFQ